ncbi:hypothetical protein GJAV_G00267610 [Gymnothorax javanicus]|nr:hypothetical protein GJAV_G00267610 [Gymnothorax javanicus]
MPHCPRVVGGLEPLPATVRLSLGWTCMSLDGGMKAELPEETHVSTAETCNLAQKGPSPDSTRTVLS